MAQRVPRLERREGGDGADPIRPSGRRQPVELGAKCRPARSASRRAFRAYLRAVFARTESWLDGLEAGELQRVVITRPFPPQIADTYSARVGGPAGITLLDAAECWIDQHGLRHMGEIELARGLVGLHGMTS